MHPFTSHNKHRLRGFLGSLVGLLAVVYFGYHALQGDHGLLAWWRLHNEIADAEQLLALRTQEMDTLQARVDRLSPKSLDRDLLDEQARRMLNVARPDEMVILLDPEEPAPLQ